MIQKIKKEIENLLYPELRPYGRSDRDRLLRKASETPLLESLRPVGDRRAARQRCQLEPKLAAHYAAIRAEVGAHPDTTISELRAWLMGRHPSVKKPD